MTITLDLTPEIEKGLIAQAQARGISLIDYLQEIVSREAQVSQSAGASKSVSEAKNLVELFANSPFRGLDMEFEREKDYGREIEL